MLFNLKKLRDDKKYIEINNLLNNDIILRKNDQTAINYLLCSNIGRLP